jgi:hypothetical protein
VVRSVHALAAARGRVRSAVMVHLLVLVLAAGTAFPATSVPEAEAPPPSILEPAPRAGASIASASAPMAAKHDYRPMGGGLMVGGAGTAAAAYGTVALLGVSLDLFSALICGAFGNNPCPASGPGDNLLVPFVGPSLFLPSSALRSNRCGARQIGSGWCACGMLAPAGGRT